MGEGKKLILEEEKKNRKKLAPIKKTIWLILKIILNQAPN
jgi:hypothetical protein